MRNKFLLMFLSAILAAAVVVLFKGPLFDYIDVDDYVFKGREIVDEIKKEVSAPPPLRAKRDHPDAFLTQEGVFNWTNSHRGQNGLPPLSANTQLNHAAALKANDMIQGQYFGHVSPDGKGPDFWIDSAGYEYVIIGENLALGNFENDQALVQAWMDSPGHRANILNERYSEIGIAVSRGVFEGRMTWFAVQAFGLPLSVCSEPDRQLKSQIESLEAQLDVLEIQLQELKDKIENTRPKHGPEYNSIVEEYNELVGLYNDVLARFKNLVSQYNNQVSEFNLCVEGV